MSAMPDSMSTDPKDRLIADLQRQLAECRAERDEAQQQLAERTIERDEAHAQQTATAEVLQVINSSPGRLQPVFEAMLGHAIRLCDANFGHFRTYDGKGFPLAAVHGESDLVELHQQRFRHFVPGPHHPISRLVRGERLIHIADAAADEAYHNDPDSEPRTPPKNYNYVEELINLQIELIKLQEYVRHNSLKVVGGASSSA